MNNTDTITYHILLKPLAPFFFGTEQGNTADYFLKGNYFPQQTALLGLIRHQLLIQNNLITNGVINDYIKAEQLIGPSSFQYNKPEQEFGIIERIGECHICKPGSIEKGTTPEYYPAPPEYSGELRLNEGSYYFPGFNAKEYYPQRFITKSTQNGNKESYTTDAIFYDTNERVGTDKNYKGQTQKDAYYKQVWITMEKSFCFGFYVTFKHGEAGQPHSGVLKDAIVTFGKESSPFQMTIQEQKDPSQVYDMWKESSGNAIYLTSDCYLRDFGIINCEVAIADTIAFRNVINRVGQQSHLYFNRNPRQNKESKRLQLFKAGSLFYTDKIDKLKNSILSGESFIKIGYNSFQFTTINILT